MPFKLIYTINETLRLINNILPAYFVYRGYIVFVFSVTMYVCLFVYELFSVKDFSGTTGPKILKFGQTLGISCCIVLIDWRRPEYM